MDCPYDRFQKPQHTITWHEKKVEDLEDTIRSLHGIIEHPNKKLEPIKPICAPAEEVFHDGLSAIFQNYCSICTANTIF